MQSVQFKRGDIAIIKKQFKKDFPQHLANQPILFAADSDKWQDELINYSYGINDKLIRHSLNPEYLEIYIGYPDDDDYFRLECIRGYWAGEYTALDLYIFAGQDAVDEFAEGSIFSQKQST